MTRSDLRPARNADDGLAVTYVRADPGIYEVHGAAPVRHTLDLDDPADRRIIASVYAQMVPR